MVKRVLKKVKRKLLKKKDEVIDRTITAKELIGKTIFEVIVVNPKLEKFGEGFNVTAAHNFPDRIVILNINKLDSNRVYFAYFADGKTTTAYVPNDFKLEVVETKSAISEDYEKFVIKNLHVNLGHSFAIGSDPEMFVEDNNGKVIPAFDFLGSKAKPNKTFRNEGSEHGQTNMYWDGFQAEFETKANTCLGWQSDSVFSGIKGLYDAAKKHNKDAKLSLKTTMDIDHDLLKVSAEEHVQFGCMPSFNAYDMKGLQLNGRDVPFRSAGGHIHYGLGKTTHSEAIPIVKALDAILAVACVSLFAKYDDPRRRTMYGLAGEYRLPPHGLEYRVLSNAWMAHPAIMNLVFDTSRKIVMLGKQEGLLKYWKHDEAKTIDIINTCNVKEARASLELNKELFQKILDAAYGQASTRSVQGAKAFLIGMENIIETPDDVEKNWLVRPGDKWINHSNAPGKNWSLASEILKTGKRVG